MLEKKKNLTFPEPNAFLLIASWTPSSISTNLNPFPWRSLSLVLLRSTKRANYFHEGLNWDCHTFLIYRDKLMTKEQIKAHHMYNFFIRRYKIDAHPVEWNHEACLHVQRLEFQMMLWNSRISCMMNWSKGMNYSYKQSTPRWCNKRSIQENLSRESFKMTTQDDNIQTTKDDNIQNSWVRHCEYYSPVKNSSCLEIKVKFHEMP